MSNKIKIELEAAIMSQAQHQNNNWTYSIYVNDFRCKVELFIKQMLLTFDQLCKEKSFFSADLCIWRYISNLAKTLNVNG